MMGSNVATAKSNINPFIERNESGNADVPLFRHGVLESVISVIGFVLFLYMTYTSFYGPYRNEIIHMAIYFGLVLVIYFLSTKRYESGPLRAYDYVCAFIGILVTSYVVLTFDTLGSYLGAFQLTAMDTVIGIGLIFIAIEAARRQSVAFAILAVAGCLYSIFGHYLPGIFTHAGIDFQRFIFLAAYGPEGVFGLGLSIAVNYLFFFMLLGAGLQNTGAGTFLLQLSQHLVGRLVGGPAKASLIASGALGSVVASPTANVVLTGSVTIPLMKRSGFSPEVAGAIETVNSEGSQLVPPILGVAVFIMAELTGIGYSEIVIASLLPAFLYYLSAWLVIDSEARKAGMKPMHLQPELMWAVLKSGWHLIMPLFLLVFLVFVVKFTPAFAGLISFLASLLICQIRHITRLPLLSIADAVDRGVREAVLVSGFTASLGLIQQTFTITGLGPRLAEIVIVLSGGSEILLIVIAAGATMFLGMGMPTALAYTLGAVFIAPALSEIGLNLLAAHLFVFFFAVKSGSTPPIAVVATVAAAVAKANWWKTGWLAFMYALPGSLAAFAWVLYPEMLFGSGFGLADFLRVLMVGVGVAGISFALPGYLFGRMGPWTRIALGASSIATLAENTVIALAATVIVIAIVVARKALENSNDNGVEIS